MEKIQMQPGVKYKGYAILNEYGEVMFTPSQKDDNPNRMKIVCEQDGMKLYESKKFFKASLLFDKSLTKTELINEAMRIMQPLVVALNKYSN